MSAPVIETRDLHKHFEFGDVLVEALRGVSVEIPEGQFLAIIGKSGSGKSTFMNILGCLDRPSKGSYLLDGHDVSKLTADERAELRGGRFGFVFQAFKGALHFIQGWTIFMACVAILFAETWLLLRLSGDGTPLYRAFRLDFPKPVADPAMTLRGGLPKPFLGSVGLVLLAVVASILMAQRATASLPARDSLVTFPMRIADWKGRQFGLEKEILDVLDLDDYVIANYKRPGDPVFVNFYVAYYASQKAGSAAHSPRSCIPGGGWRITELSERAIDNSGGSPLVVNRVVIRKGNLTQLVYYWFEGQGRVLTNEYLIKWYLLWDGVTRNRTDGALVRLVTQVPDRDHFEQADRRLTEFVRAVYPKFPAYIPR